jgi:hypothetical protein
MTVRLQSGAQDEESFDEIDDETRRRIWPSANPGTALHENREAPPLSADARTFAAEGAGHGSGAKRERILGAPRHSGDDRETGILSDPALSVRGRCSKGRHRRRQQKQSYGAKHRNLRGERVAAWAGEGGLDHALRTASSIPTVGPFGIEHNGRRW